MVQEFILTQNASYILLGITVVLINISHRCVDNTGIFFFIILLGLRPFFHWKTWLLHVPGIAHTIQSSSLRVAGWFRSSPETNQTSLSGKCTLVAHSNFTSVLCEIAQSENVQLTVCGFVIFQKSQTVGVAVRLLSLFLFALYNSC